MSHLSYLNESPLKYKRSHITPGKDSKPGMQWEEERYGPRIWGLIRSHLYLANMNNNMLNMSNVQRKLIQAALPNCATCRCAICPTFAPSLKPNKLHLWTQAVTRGAEPETH